MDPSEFVARMRRRLVPSGSVVERAITSGVWEGSLNTVNRLIQLGKITILARLIPPQEFGILGIGFLVLAVFESFSQLGIDQALIQRQEGNVDEYLDTSWTLQILRGLLLTGAIFLLAPYAASWFGEPRATNVIRALAIGPLLLGLKNPGVVYFQKDLHFHRRFVQILSGTIVNFVIAISFGVLLGNVWALVAGSVVGNIASVIVSFVLHEYRPRPRLDLERARELIDYGKWVFGNAIMRFLKNQGDDVFVGWFLGATPLAFYQMAYRFSNAPSTELTNVIGTVTFPSLSQVQEDYQKLRNGYFRTLRFSVFLAVPAAVGIALVADPFVRALLGSDWLPAIPVMQLLAIMGAVRVINSGSGPVFYTLSRPDISLKLNLLRVVLIALGIFPAADKYGLIGVAVIIVGVFALITPVQVYITLYFISGSLIRYLSNIIHPLVGSSIMTATLLVIQTKIRSAAIVELLILIVAGLTVYVVYTWAATKLFNYRIGEDIDAVVDSILST